MDEWNLIKQEILLNSKVKENVLLISLYDEPENAYKYVQLLPIFSGFDPTKSRLLTIDDKYSKEIAENKIAAGEMFTSIVDFYAGKSIFITGGTGFLGKVLIEKLLYSCPKIKTIYILIREKRGMSAAERLQKILDMPFFSRVKEQRPEDLKKIIPIIGCIDMPNMNICPKDIQTLIEEVSVVIHSAATVKFNEPLKVALRINLEGTRNVLEFSRRMKNIEAFVYVSTAYSNSNQEVIEEMLYPPPAKVHEVYEFVTQFGDDEEKLVEFLNGRANTYTYSKALAETLIAEFHGHVPTVIVRPAAITASEKEPLQGWVDSWFGPGAFLTTVGKGICRVVLSDANNILDLIPVDYVSNLILVAAARSKRTEEVAIYNSCSSCCNPITIEETVKSFSKESVKHKFNELPFPGVVHTNNKLIVNIITGLQLVLAFIGDLFRRIRGKSSRYLNNVRRANLIRDSFEYFTSRSWVIRCDRARALSASLCAQDQQLFPFDPTNIDWTQYMHVYFKGILRYLIKPTAESVNNQRSN